MPREIIKAMDLKAGDDIDFIPYKDYFIITKRSDIAKLITSQQREGQNTQQQRKQFSVPKLSEDELKVLKKLDTLRYSMRTTAEVSKLLDKEERITFRQLEKKGIITPFKDAEQKTHYSIQKMFYDNYLMRKRPAASAPEPQKHSYNISPSNAKAPIEAQANATPTGAIEKYISVLQESGYLVVPTEADASALSAALEDSIRQGQVIGTRAFNKKFYIATRTFILKETPMITSQLSNKSSSSISDIAKACKIDEEAARAVLYILGENGDITEVRKDVFRLA